MFFLSNFQFQHSSKTLLWHRHLPLCSKWSVDDWCIFGVCNFSQWFQAIMSVTTPHCNFPESSFAIKSLDPPQNKPVFLIVSLTYGRMTYVSQTLPYWHSKAWGLFAVLQPWSRNLLCCVTIKLNKIFCFRLIHVFYLLSLLYTNLNTLSLKINTKDW